MASRINILLKMNAAKPNQKYRTAGSCQHGKLASGKQEYGYQDTKGGKFSLLTSSSTFSSALF
jgi:hypothetical protein